MSEVTRIVELIADDLKASDELIPLVYDELRRIASAKIAKEAPGNTLQTTALVHEVYLRLVGKDGGPQWKGRGQFFAAAAEAMRRILIESARRKGRVKRGRGVKRVDLDMVSPTIDGPNDDLLALDEVLTLFSEVEPAKAELVKLRYFAGFTSDEAAEILGISSATADRYWKFARAWLAGKLQRGYESKAES